MSLIPAKVGLTLGRQALVLQKNSPHILFGLGITGVITSTVLACRATLKMDEILQESKQRQILAHSIVDNEEYTETDRQEDIAKIHFKTSVKIVRLYAPAVIVGGLSIAALTGSHRILTSRNAALTAAYTALEEGFNRYRARVVDRYGEDVDRELRYDTEVVTIKDVDTGKTTKVTRVAGDYEPSIYARFFDRMSPSWSREPEYNLIFLKAQQNYANDLLKARGHIFLNEVYNSLGLKHSKAGSVVGWVLSHDGSTDNHVSFGIFDNNDDQKIRDFVNGHEGSILLDFNVDGVIYHKIEDVGEELSWQLGH